MSIFHQGGTEPIRQHRFEFKKIGPNHKYANPKFENFCCMHNHRKTISIKMEEWSLIAVAYRDLENLTVEKQTKA